MAEQMVDKRIRHILRLVGQGEIVLDIGCGCGYIAELLQDENNSVYGIEVDPWKATEAMKKMVAVNMDIETGTPPWGEFFDVVLAGECIEHIIDTGKFLEKVHTLLKPDGRLIITTPNLASLGRRIYLFFGRNPLLETALNPSGPGHIRYFTLSALRTLLERHGFKIRSFCSDTVNFSVSGKWHCDWLARVFPLLGRTLIVEAVRL